jgi:prepilin-type N-terminal cleavage/methylation domain-containing protein
MQVRHRNRQAGFSLLEMLLATIILLVGLVAIAQLVPASILLNYRNRTDSSATVFLQNELDQFLDQPLVSASFSDNLGNLCSLGNPATPNIVLPSGSYVVTVNNQTMIDFTQTPVSGYSLLYSDMGDPADPRGIVYDVRWAVITLANGTTVSAKRFIIGVRQQGGSGYFQPVTLDTMISR